jgi:SAM-dependent methyltransferase
VLELLLRASPLKAREVLELGSGGGSLSSHFKPHFRMTLSDLSNDMLAVSRELNPECEHVQGDMRTLDLGRQFQRVLIHDAIMYLTSPDAVRAAIANAARHVCPGGAVVIFPDCVRETFAAGTEHDGADAPDGRGLRWLEWRWDPEPADDTFVTAYSFLFREPDGTLSVELDRHEEGLFSRNQWLSWLSEAGLEPSRRSDSWRADVFVGLKR